MPGDKTVSTIHVFRVYRNDEWRFVYQGYSDLTYSNDARGAKPFHLDDVEGILNFHRRIMRDNKIDDIEFVKVTITTELEEIPLDQDDFLEERRRRALQKLTEDEIRALGLQELAMYSKLKFHGEK